MGWNDLDATNTRKQPMWDNNNMEMKIQAKFLGFWKELYIVV